MPHPLKNFTSFILAFTFFTYPLSSQAQEYTGMEDDTAIVQEDNNYPKTNLFVRLGATLSSGTIFDESASHKLVYPFTHSNNITQNDFSSLGALLSIGIKLRQKRGSGLQIIGVVKSGHDSTERQNKLAYTQFGSAMELYYGNNSAKFLLGTLISYGRADYPSSQKNSADYIALEPFIGLEIAMTHYLALITKVGYEWRDYETIYYNDNVSSHTSKSSSYNVTGSFLLQYAF